MKICVTGGAGFLGSNLVDRLIKEDHEVIIFDNLERSGDPNPDAKFIKGDILSAYDVDKIPKVDLMVHTAAVCGVETCISNPYRIIQDFDGTQNIVRKCTKNKVEKLIYFSTGEIYGDSAMGAEESQKINIWNTHEPRVAYTLSKLLCEMLVNITDINSIILRPFNVDGPKQKGTGVVRNFIEWGLKREPIQVYNAGTEIRAMCYIDDFIDGVYSACINDIGRKNTINLGNPYTATTVKNIAKIVQKATGGHSEIIHVKKDYVDKRGVTPDIQRAISLLGYNPQIDLEEGIRRTVEWYKSQKI